MFCVGAKVFIFKHIPTYIYNPLSSAFIVLSSSFSSCAHSLDSSTYAYCHDTDNCSGAQYCDEDLHRCFCKRDYYFVLAATTCPTLGMPCYNCCCGQNVFCNEGFCEPLRIGDMSSQLILTIIMVMGIVSVCFMVYRICYVNNV